MQKVSSKKMSHQEAERYRHKVQDAVMYQHKNGTVYVVKSPEEDVFGVAEYVGEDVSILKRG